MAQRQDCWHKGWVAGRTRLGRCRGRTVVGRSCFGLCPGRLLVAGRVGRVSGTGPVSGWNGLRLGVLVAVGVLEDSLGCLNFRRRPER